MPEKLDLRPVFRQVRDMLGDKIEKTTHERDEIPVGNPDRACLDRLLMEFSSAKDKIENRLMEISVEEMQAAASEIESIDKNINKEIKALTKVSDNVKNAANIVKIVTETIVALAKIATI